MSRTYRKQIRHYTKYRGEYYNSSYKPDRTVKNAPRNLKEEDDCKDIIYRWGYPANATDSAAYHRFEVLVSDSECYGIRCPKDVKRLCHKKDRARVRQALYHHPEDVYFKPAFDPWDWD